ncbi:NAD(P)-dependent alcohol dehydrogenase [Algoriphagus machipongonensis]|nr:NAD(P)-dependent alcohol dehydrogenase [Algoriphagus machipongonensis]
MKAITKHHYGGPEVLGLEEVEKPRVKEKHLLVKVKANSVNPADWHTLRGEPYFARLSFGLFKPKDKILGADFAGIVEEVGQGVSQFKVGDRVFGEYLDGGSFAEYVCVPESVCGLMPKDSSEIEMAAVPIAGLTALQAIITHGKLESGENVLINGSSGGVGHFAVQIAKAYGAHVTGVCSSRNVDFVKSLGADQVIAYDQESIHEHNGNYDLVLDTHGNLNFADYKRMGKRGVLIGFTGMGQMMGVLLKKFLKNFPIALFTASANTDDLETLARLIHEGKVKPHIEKTYPFTQFPEAIAYIENMRTRGKVTVTWEI